MPCIRNEPSYWDVRAVGLSLVLVVSVVQGAWAQEAAQWRGVRGLTYDQVVAKWDCGLRGIDANAFVRHRSPRSKQREAAARILADYGENAPIPARRAFERAIKIWESHISSPVPIRIEVRFEDLGPGPLAGASPRLVIADTTGDGRGDVILGSPLLDARTGKDQLPRKSDIRVLFNTSAAWHYGAEPAPAETIDFTTVALHEIGHGLNYIDLFRVSGISGVYGTDFDRNGRVDVDERYAGAFGRHLVQTQADGGAVSLTDTDIFPNPSPILGDALRSDSLFFKGKNAEREARQAAGPDRPKVYAPERFKRGSSISHLDEQTYSPETENALMTPFIKRAETIRQPGSLLCGQLIDMGWEPGPGCALGTLELSGFEGTVTGKQVGQGRTIKLSWELRGAASDAESVRKFVVEQQQFVGAGTPKPFARLETVSAKGVGTYSLRIEDVKVGQHAFRIATAEGSAPPIIRTVSVEAEQPDVSVYPNPFSESAKISFVLPEAQFVKVEVFDALGRKVSTPFVGKRPANTARPMTFTPKSVPASASGVYFFRVTGEHFVQTEKAVYVR